MNQIAPVEADKQLSVDTIRKTTQSPALQIMLNPELFDKAKAMATYLSQAMRPDQFQARMKTICANRNITDVKHDALLLIVSTMADEMPGYRLGLKLFQERLSEEPTPAAKAAGAVP